MQLHNTVQNTKHSETKIPILIEFCCAEHENDIKNLELALVCKLQKGSHKNKLLLSRSVECLAPRWCATAF